MSAISDHLPDRTARGWALLQSQRADLAEREFRSALSDNPDDASALSGLALTLSILDRDTDAREAATATIRIAPELPLGHAVLAMAEQALRRPKIALPSIETAIRLDPHNAWYRGIKARTLMDLDRRQEALDTAEHGLSLDPEDGLCLSVRSIALVRLNRTGDAVEGARRSLALEPESPYAHATLGQTLLMQGKTKAAAEHFREALRRKPDLEIARQGLLHTLRARLVIYRLFLWWLSFCTRMPSRVVTIAIVAIFFLPSIMRGVSAAYPALGDAVLVLRILLAVFVLLTWAAVPIFNGLLLLTRDGRLLLSRTEQLWAAATLSAVVLAFGFLGASYLPNVGDELSEVFGRAALSAALLLIPLGAASTFADESAAGRWFTRGAVVAFLALFAHWTVVGGSTFVFLALTGFWLALLLPIFRNRGTT
ncbi:MAG: tetratricopeptide repeat protein [Phycisphaerae bacterium]|nr:tetratricopeptide repeat protein [Phycisphaerae bacterium]